MKFLVAVFSILLLALPLAAQERSGPLSIEITQGVIEPVPIAVSFSDVVSSYTIRDSRRGMNDHEGLVI